MQGTSFATLPTVEQASTRQRRLYRAIRETLRAMADRKSTRLNSSH